MAKTLLIKLAADTSAYNKAMTQAANQAKILNKTFELQKLTAKGAENAIKSHNMTLENQKKIYQNLNSRIQLTAEMLQKVSAEYGAASAQAEKYRMKLLDLQIAQAGVGKSIKNLSAQGGPVLFMNGLQKQLQGAGGMLQNAGNAMKGAGMTATFAITAPLAYVGKSMVQMAMDAYESESMFNVTLGKMSNEARDFSEKLGSALKLNTYAIRKNIATFDAMLKSMGLGEKSAYDMSAGLSQLAYDLSSFYNIKPDIAFEKLRSGIVGETEPLKQLGVNINETQVKTYALTKGLIKQGQEMSEAQKVIARYGLIMQSTAIAQGDMARTMDSPANKLRIMQERFDMLQISVGQKLIPVFIRFLEILNNLMDKFNSLDPGMQNNILNFGMFAAAAGPVIWVLGGIFGAIGTLLNVGGTLVGWLSGAATAFTAAGGAAGVFGAIVAALSSPVVIIAGVLAALGTVVAWLYNTFDWAANGINEAWTWATNALSAACIFIEGTFNDLQRAVNVIASGIVGKLNGIIDGINKVIGGLNALPFAKIGLIPKIDASGFDRDAAIFKSRAEINYDAMNYVWSGPKRNAGNDIKNTWGGILDGLKSALNGGGIMKNIQDIFKTPQLTPPDMSAFNKGVQDGIDALKDDFKNYPNPFEKLKDAGSQALDKLTDKVEQFGNAIKQQTENFGDFVELFERVKRERFSGDNFLANLRGQLKMMKEWQGALVNLRERLGGGSGLYQKLLDMGPGKAGQIAALAKLSDAKLAEYASLYTSKQNIAGQMATESVILKNQEEQKMKQVVVNITGNQIKDDIDITKIADMVVLKLKVAGVL